MAKALGMIETRGLIGSIEAADAMMKAADVRLLKQENVDAALVTVLIEGDVSAVQAAVEVGKEAALRVGELISVHVIPNPDEGIGQILLNDHKKSEIKPPKTSGTNKKIPNKTAKLKAESQKPQTSDSKETEEVDSPLNENL